MWTEDLGNAGEARADLIPNPAEAWNLFFVGCNELGWLWPRANETHVAAQDVQQLGQLVKRCFPKDSAYHHHLMIVRMHRNSV
jgi:hypothetical protein